MKKIKQKGYKFDGGETVKSPNKSKKSFWYTATGGRMD